jgi:hypothetical protein
MPGVKKNAPNGAQLKSGNTKLKCKRGEQTRKQHKRKRGRKKKLPKEKILGKELFAVYIGIQRRLNMWQRCGKNTERN